MKNFLKAGLLIVTLVIPALVFVFLRFFATNHYALPYFHPVLDAGGHVQFKGADTLFYRVSKLGLEIGSVPISQGDFDSKVTVVNLLPAVCDDTCRNLLSQLERIYALRADIRDLRILSLKDQMTRDSSATYPSELGLKGWDIATGSTEELAKAVNGDFRFETKVPKAKTNSLETKLVLVDRESHIRGYYNGADPEEIDRLMAEIKILNYRRD